MEFEDTSNIACSIQEGKTLELLNSLNSGKLALAKFLGIYFFKPVALEVIRRSMTYAFKAQLIRDWILDPTNLVGMKLIDKETAAISPEIIDRCAEEYINGIVNRSIALIDVIVAVIQRKTFIKA